MLEVDYNRLNIDDKINILLNDHANGEPMKAIHVIALIEKFNSLKRQSKNNYFYSVSLENNCEVYRRMLYGYKTPDEVLDEEFEAILHELLLEKEAV